MPSVLFILSKILSEHYFDLTGKIPFPAGCENYALQPAHRTPYTLYLLVTYKQVHQIETVYIDQTHVCQL